MSRCEDSCIIGYRINTDNKIELIMLCEYVKMNPDQQATTLFFTYCPYCGTEVKDLIEEYNEYMSDEHKVYVPE